MNTCTAIDWVDYFVRLHDANPKRTQYAGLINQACSFWGAEKTEIVLGFLFARTNKIQGILQEIGLLRSIKQ